MKRIFILFLFFLYTCPFYAVDNLRLADIRSLGLGGNGVTQSLLSNPALVSSYSHSYLYTNYLNRYAVKELGTMQVGWVCPSFSLPLAIDISSFGYDSYRESMFRVMVGKQVGRKWRIGMSVQYSLLQTMLTNEVPKRLSADLGLLYSPVDKMLIGMLIMNVPTVSLEKKYTDIKDFTEYSIQIGFQYSVINNLLIIGTAESNKSDPLTGSGGIEYQPFSNFCLRAGLKVVPLLPALGLGYSFSHFTADAAFLYHPVLGVSMGIGVKYGF